MSKPFPLLPAYPFIDLAVCQYAHLKVQQTATSPFLAPMAETIPSLSPVIIYNKNSAQKSLNDCSKKCQNDACLREEENEQTAKNNEQEIRSIIVTIIKSIGMIRTIVVMRDRQKTKKS
jgi:hypothetical protein